MDARRNSGLGLGLGYTERHLYAIVYKGVQVLNMQIRVTQEVKDKLNARKIIPEEPYWKVISRLLEATK